jgi:transcriptional antiterminator RfaH
MKKLKRKKNETIWVLIYTKPKQEIKANENLQKQGFKTFLPLIAASNKISECTPTPVFPRYLFAQLNLSLENWSSIRSTYGVSKIIMFGEDFTIVPNKIIKLIQDKLNEEGIYKEEISNKDFKKGDSLTIKEGRFAGVDAIFLANKSKDRVTLLLKLLKTTVSAEIPKADVGHKKVIKKFKF